jgi:hypothetical protein
MKKLRNYEIDALVEVIWKKLNDEKRSKMIWIGKFDEINLLMKKKGNEINRLIDEFYKVREDFKKQFGNNSGNWVLYNMSGIGRYNDREEFVKINECDLLNWNLKNNIRNEIIVSNIEGNISDIIDVLFEKYKNII